MSTSLSISDVLADLEAQIAHLEEQEALHARQEELHREQRVRCAGELERIRGRYEGFKAAATAAGEVVRPKPRLAAEDDTGSTTISKLVARWVQARPADERFTPSSLARELNQRHAKALRRPLDGRAVSVTLRRLAAEGRLRVVQKGRAFHEAVYSRGSGR